MLLALDLGTNMGWATYDGNNTNTGVINFKGDRFSGGGMRYLKFQKWLGDLPPPTQIVYEEVRQHAGTTAAHVYGGFMAVLTAFCEERVIPYDSTPVGTIKNHWTGKGNAGKEQMIAYGHEKGYTHITDDNEMDALALLDYWKEKGVYVL